MDYGIFVKQGMHGRHYERVISLDVQNKEKLARFKDMLSTSKESTMSQDSALLVKQMIYATMISCLNLQLNSAQDIGCFYPHWLPHEGMNLLQEVMKQNMRNL